MLTFSRKFLRAERTSLTWLTLVAGLASFIDASGAAGVVDRGVAASTKQSFSFEPNVGQTAEDIFFLAHSGGFSLFLKRDRAVFHFADPQANTRHRGDRVNPLRQTGNPCIFEMRVGHASTSAIAVGLGRQPTEINYYGPSGRQFEHIPTFGSVEWRELVPGVDMVYYSTTEGSLQYDFRVAPGGNPKSIELQFEGDLGKPALRLNRGGDLVLTMGEDAEVKWKKPVAYQTINDRRKEVPAGYSIGANDVVTFSLGPYDDHYSLVIDPVLTYSSYLGGSATDEGEGIAIDNAGNVWITGYTDSHNFPLAGSPYQDTKGNTDNSPDVFVSKFSPAGTLLYSTYLGGMGDDIGAGIAVDSSGNPWISGQTRSGDFPLTGSAAQGANAGGTDAFVAKFSATGNLLYSSYLGGSGEDKATAIGVDEFGNAWITGATQSNDFRTAGNPIQSVNRGGMDAFISKFGPTGNLLYSTYLGGANDDLGNGISIGSDGNAWVTGGTFSTNFPSTGAPVQATNGGLSDAFVARFSPAGLLVYSTFLGGVNDDTGFAIACDSQGNAWVAGDTGSANFPTTVGAYRTSYPGLEDAFVTKFSSNGAMAYSTYLGGSNLDAAHGIALTPNGDAFVTGFTTSSNDFPLSPNPVQSTFGGGFQDIFITKFTASGTFTYSTFFGGTAVEGGNAIAVDGTGKTWLTGYTASSDFPLAGTPFQTVGGGNTVDGFVVRLDDNGSPPTEHYLLNISTRARVETAENVVIGGFIVQGTKPKRVILRAIGPSLSLSGVPPSEALQDPVLELHDSTGTIVISNDNWRDSPQKQAIIDSTLSPIDDPESAVVAALAPGTYTATVSGSGLTTGVGLVELYDIDAASSARAVNISTRARVGSGGNVMIGGFILGGTMPTSVLVRAIGPSLPVASALQDPTLELRNENGTIEDSNDNWGDNPDRQAIINTGIPPVDDRESALLDTLSPGGHTATVRGAGGSEGVALVEVYDLN